MSRKKTQPKKNVIPDAKFNSTIIPKLINNIMYDGKRGIAAKIVYDAIEKIISHGNVAKDIKLEKNSEKFKNLFKLSSSDLKLGSWFLYKKFSPALATSSLEESSKLLLHPRINTEKKIKRINFFKLSILEGYNLVLLLL